MQRILSLLFLAIAINLPVSLFALTGEEAIAMLEAASFAHSENESRREAGVKKMAYPAMIPVEKGFDKNYERIDINWGWHKTLTRVGKSAQLNNGSIRDAYLSYSTLRTVNFLVINNTIYLNVGSNAFFTIFENMQRYPLPLESGKKVSNRFQHFDLYLHELAELDINARQKKITADIGNNRTASVVSIFAKDINQYEKTKKEMQETGDFERKLSATEYWAHHNSFANANEQRKLLIDAFGEETYTRWQTEHPYLIKTNHMLGIFTIQLASLVLYPEDKTRLDNYKHLFIDLFLGDIPAELLKTEAGAIKNLRAFHKKYLADIAKAEKKAAKGK